MLPCFSLAPCAAREKIKGNNLCHRFHRKAHFISSTFLSSLLRAQVAWSKVFVILDPRDFFAKVSEITGRFLPSQNTSYLGKAAQQRLSMFIGARQVLKWINERSQKEGKGENETEKSEFNLIFEKR